jgi:hypothetical protein
MVSGNEKPKLLSTSTPVSVYMADRPQKYEQLFVVMFRNCPVGHAHLLVL